MAPNYQGLFDSFVSAFGVFFPFGPLVILPSIQRGKRILSGITATWLVTVVVWGICFFSPRRGQFWVIPEPLNTILSWLTGFVTPETVEDTPNHLRKLTFPGGFSCYAQSEPDEVVLIYNEIMVMQEYFQRGLSIMQARCVMDVGANIGIFTMAVKLKAPEATVYAFEPIPDTFRVLEQNVRLLGGSDVHLFNVAIGSEDHVEKTFAFFPHMPGGSTAIPALKVELKRAMDKIFGKEGSDFLIQSEMRLAEARTLSSIIREQGITSVDYLKVDIEGSEVSLFEGIEEMHWPIFKQVAVETHSAQLREQVCEILVQHGFQVDSSLIFSPVGTSMVYAHRS